jgi:hypothetical protein
VAIFWVGGDVTDLGNEVPGDVIDLAFHPDQPRGPDGRWIGRGGWAGGAGISHMPESFAPPPDDFMERQRATRRQLVAASQRRILEALTASPDKMDDQQIYAASQVIGQLAPHDYAEIRRRTKEVVPAHIADHVDAKVAALAKDLQGEQNQDARKKLIGGLALVLGALALSFITAGLGVPVGIAALIGILPELGKEYKDFLVDRKKASLVERAS